MQKISSKIKAVGPFMAAFLVVSMLAAPTFAQFGPPGGGPVTPTFDALTVTGASKLGTIQFDASGNISNNGNGVTIKDATGLFVDDGAGNKFQVTPAGDVWQFDGTSYINQGNLITTVTTGGSGGGAGGSITAPWTLSTASKQPVFSIDSLGTITNPGILNSGALFLNDLQGVHLVQMGITNGAACGPNFAINSSGVLSNPGTCVLAPPAGLVLAQTQKKVVINDTDGITLGGGDAEVTKNLLADQALKVGKDVNGNYNLMIDANGVLTHPGIGNGGILALADGDGLSFTGNATFNNSVNATSGLNVTGIASISSDLRVGKDLATGFANLQVDTNGLISNPGNKNNGSVTVSDLNGLLVTGNPGIAVDATGTTVGIKAKGTGAGSFGGQFDGTSAGVTANNVGTTSAYGLQAYGAMAGVLSRATNNAGVAGRFEAFSSGNDVDLGTATYAIDAKGPAQFNGAITNTSPQNGGVVYVNDADGLKSATGSSSTAVQGLSSGTGVYGEGSTGVSGEASTAGGRGGFFQDSTNTKKVQLGMATKAIDATGDVNVAGKITATQLGSSYTLTSNVLNVANGSTATKIVGCNDAVDIPVSCGAFFTGTSQSTINRLFLDTDNLCKASGTNNSGIARTFNLYLTCIDITGP